MKTSYNGMPVYGSSLFLQFFSRKRSRPYTPNIYGTKYKTKNHWLTLCLLNSSTPTSQSSATAGNAVKCAAPVHLSQHAPAGFAKASIASSTTLAATIELYVMTATPISAVEKRIKGRG